MIEATLKALLEKTIDLITPNVDYRKKTQNALSPFKYDFTYYLWDTVLDCKYSWRIIYSTLPYLKFKDESSPKITFQKRDIKISNIEFFLGFFLLFLGIVLMAISSILGYPVIVYIASFFLLISPGALLILKNGNIFILLNIEKELKEHYEKYGDYNYFNNNA